MLLFAFRAQPGHTRSRSSLKGKINNQKTQLKMTIRRVSNQSYHIFLHQHRLFNLVSWADARDLTKQQQAMQNFST